MRVGAAGRLPPAGSLPKPAECARFAKSLPGSKHRQSKHVRVIDVASPARTVVVFWHDTAEIPARSRSRPRRRKKQQSQLRVLREPFAASCGLAENW